MILKQYDIADGVLLVEQDVLPAPDPAVPAQQQCGGRHTTDWQASGGLYRCGVCGCRGLPDLRRVRGFLRAAVVPNAALWDGALFPLAAITNNQVTGSARIVRAQTQNLDGRNSPAGFYEFASVGAVTWA